MQAVSSCLVQLKMFDRVQELPLQAFLTLICLRSLLLIFTVGRAERTVKLKGKMVIKGLEAKKTYEDLANDGRHET